MNRFETLAAINCNDKTEKKNGLTYLSWAWAWDQFKRLYPDSYYTVYEGQNGCLYHTDGHTCWVKTGVTLVDGDFKLEHIEYLPIMGFNNKSLSLESVTSFDVNKSIQRSLTKAVARHGLGLYIYAGEDLPTEEIPINGTPADKPPADYKAESPKKAKISQIPLCKKCGIMITGTTKNGVLISPMEVAEKTGGLCIKCAKEQKK
jgi:hypothetical protein